MVNAKRLKLIKEKKRVDQQIKDSICGLCKHCYNFYYRTLLNFAFSDRNFYSKKFFSEALAIYAVLLADFDKCIKKEYNITFCRDRFLKFYVELHGLLKRFMFLSWEHTTEIADLYTELSHLWLSCKRKKISHHCKKFVV